MHSGGFFLYLYIFGVDVSHLVISLSSLTVAFAFIFGNNLRTIYESVLFLFVVRPYKVRCFALLVAGRSICLHGMGTCHRLHACSMGPVQKELNIGCRS